MCGLDLEAEGTGLALYELHCAAKEQARRARELVASIEAAVIEHIEATHRDVELPTGQRWYVGTAKKTVCRDDLATAEAVVQASGGVLDRLVSGDQGVLASAPWKHAAVRSLIGEARYSELFRTEEVADLKTGAGTRKELRQTSPVAIPPSAE